VLREAGAQKKNIPHCVAWVRRFFAKHPGRRRRDLGRTEIEAFLAETAQHPGMSNWQVQQARDALELYYEQFRSITLKARPDSIQQKSTSPPFSTPPTRPFVESDSINNVRKSYLADRGNGKGKNRSFVKYLGATVTPPASTHQVDVAPPLLRERPVASRGAAVGPIVAETPPAPDHPARDSRKALIGLAFSKSQGKPAPEAAKADPTTKISTGLNWRALDGRVRECMRLEHYSYRTEQTYVAWIRRFVLFHQWQKPS
jgi:hypothetical protein